MVVSRRHHAIGTLRNLAEKGVDSGALDRNIYEKKIFNQDLVLPS